jgi:hypothetical protein
LVENHQLLAPRRHRGQLRADSGQVIGIGRLASGSALWLVERDRPNATVRSWGDALWWSLSTMTIALDEERAFEAEAQTLEQRLELRLDRGAACRSRLAFESRVADLNSVKKSNRSRNHS